MEKVKQEHPKWLYSKTKGARLIKDALEEAQLDSADEWRDTPWPAPSKLAQSDPTPDGKLPPGPCQHCKEQEAMFDSSWKLKIWELAELQKRFDALKDEFELVSAESASAKDALAKVKTTKKAEVATAKDGE